MMAQVERTGLFQFLEYSLAGEIESPLPIGIVDGGNLELAPNTRRRLGIGGTELRRGGLIVPGGTATFYVTKTNIDLLGYGLRASYPRGALTELDFRGGADEWAIAYLTAVITNFTIDYAQDEGLKATINWQSLRAEKDTTGGTQAGETELDFEDYEFVASLGGAQYGVNAFSVTVNNKITFRSSADSKDEGALRFPTHYVYGDEELTLSVTTDRPLNAATLGILADCLPTNLQFVAVGSNCSNDTLTLMLSHLMPADPEAMGLVGPETPVGWTYGFIGSAAQGSLSLAIS